MYGTHRLLVWSATAALVAAPPVAGDVGSVRLFSARSVAQLDTPCPAREVDPLPLILRFDLPDPRFDFNVSAVECTIVAQKEGAPATSRGKVTMYLERFAAYGCWHHGQLWIRSPKQRKLFNLNDAEDGTEIQFEPEVVPEFPCNRITFVLKPKGKREIDFLGLDCTIGLESVVR